MNKILNQETLNQTKVSTRIENEKYLRKHPEIKDILEYLVSEILKKQPESVIPTVIEIMSDNELKENVEKYKENLLVLDI